jgi:hypothetical protein
VTQGASAVDVVRGESIVKGVLLRLAWLSTLLAVLPAVLGYGEITPTRIVRLLITIGICLFVYRGAAWWAKWLLIPPVAGFILGSGGALLLLRPFSAWDLVFLGVGVLYAYFLSRLWLDRDAVAFLERVRG